LTQGTLEITDWPGPKLLVYTIAGPSPAQFLFQNFCPGTDEVTDSFDSLRSNASGPSLGWFGSVPVHASALAAYHHSFLAGRQNLFGIGLTAGSFPLQRCR